MPSSRKRLVPGWALLIACLGMALPWAPADPLRSPQPLAASSLPLPAPRRVEPFKLDLHRKIRRRLDGDTLHRYSFDLRTGQVLDARVDQEGTDVVVRLIAPDGHELFLADSLNGAHEPEEIFLLAASTGRYYADVYGSGGKGAYRIWVHSIHWAGDKDQLRDQAEKLFHHAIGIQGDQRGQAVLELGRAERLWWRAGNAQRRQADALRRMGVLLEKSPGKKNWKKISKLRFQARDLYRSVGDRESEIHMLIQAGIVSRQSGDIEGAENCYREALSMLAKGEFPAERANALLSLGVLLGQRGDTWGAMDALQEALPLWRNSEFRDREVDTLLALGGLAGDLGKDQTALENFQEAARRAGSTDFASLAKIQTRTSELYQKLGDLPMALANGTLALTNRRKAKDLRGEGVSLVCLGLIYQAMGDLARARNVEEQALTIFRSQSYRSEEALTHIDLGEVLLDQADPRGAIEHFHQALEIADEQSAEEVKALALYGMGRAEKLRRNPINAQVNLLKALSVFEALSNDTVPDEFPGDLPRKRQRAYDLLIDLLVRSPGSATPRESLETAFAANERNRWRSLLKVLQADPLRSRQAGKPAPALLAERWKLQELSRRLDEERRRRQRQRRSYKDILREQRLVAERLRTIDAQIQRSAASASPTPEAVAVSLREAQAMLDGATVLLEYHLGEERSYLWRVTGSSAEVFVLPPRPVIEEQVRQLHGFLSERARISQERAVPVAEKLSGILLGPVADRLGDGRLVIVPDGILNYVPFGFLPDPVTRRPGERKPKASPLLLRHEIVYLPSVSVLRAIRSKVESRKPPAGLLALFAAPVFAPGEFDPLPNSLDEGNRILSMASGAKTLRAFGYDANRDLAMSGKLSEFRILHFATHALNHPAHPDLSSIVLSQLDPAGKRRDGDLRLLDIRDLHLSSDLVVLSACRTALGTEIEGEGLVGLSEGFLHAGAARVVVSLWDVNEESTPDLMEHFYHALLVEHRTPSEALREAQRWMATQSVWRSPYYWAGFEIHGEWR